MTSHLKVDGCSSRCTTPSERPDTQMVSVKVGCLHVNPATKHGRRTLLFHMLVLCFVPHAALVAQNCTIMAQLSHTLDSSLFLHSKASLTLTLENTVEAIQEERVSVAKYLFLKSRETMEKEDVVDLSAVQAAFSETDVLLDELSPPMIRDEHKLSLYDLKKADSLKRMAVYGEFNRTLLLYIMRYVRFTTSALWRHLSTSYELLKSMEEVSLALVAALFLSSEDFDVDTSSRLQKHHQLALERLQAAVQYLEAEELFDKAKTLMEIIVFYEESAREMSNPAATRTQRGIDLKFYTHQSNACLNKLKNVKNAYWDIIRDSVRVEMWQARRTLAIGVAILVTVLLASPVLVLMLRHTVHTIQVSKMPRKYQRKSGVVPRHISWTEDNLALAFEELDIKQKGINEISRIYGIPSRTLRRRYEKKDQQLLTQGKHPVLGFENEKRLAALILKLQDVGFSPKRSTICQLAYQFAENFGLKHNFNNETKTAGPQWLKSFLERNPEIVLSQAEGLSSVRVEVANFFKRLTTVLTDNDLLDKPDRIFNMDETSVQLNKKLGEVLAKKGATAVKSVTSGEKEETITVIACCNASGNFLPPVLIIREVNKKTDFEEGLPPGSKVYMNKKSAYISSDLFYKWLTEHFISCKPPGKVLLILDGHSSHSSAVNMLEAARDNDVVLLCLPSHTTSTLQPLDRSVFGPFIKYYFAEANNLKHIDPQKKLNRYSSGQLIAKAWIRATTPANAICGFRGSGIYPVNPNALSDAEFTKSDIVLGKHAQKQELDPLNDEAPGVSGEPVLCDCIEESVPDLGFALNQRNEASPLGDQDPSYADKSNLESKVLNKAEHISVNQNHTPSSASLSFLNLSQDCLTLEDGFMEKYLDGSFPSFPSLPSSNESQKINLEKETLSKVLNQSLPIPNTPLGMSKNAKNAAKTLNANNKIDQNKNEEEKIKKKIIIPEIKNSTAKNKDLKTEQNKPAGSTKSTVKKTGQLIAKAWIRATTPANAICGLRGCGIYPVNPNALSDAEFAISDIALGKHAQKQKLDPLNDEAPGVSGEPVLFDCIEESVRDLGFALNQRNEASPLGDQVPSYVDKSNLESKVLNKAEQISVNQNHTSSSASLSFLNLSQDCLCLTLDDSSMEKYLDGSFPSFPSLPSSNESQKINLEKETPSKVLNQSSPIPNTPLGMSKNAKNAAETLSANNKIDQNKNEEEKIKKKIKYQKLKTAQRKIKI